jgi:hypothetical protein
MVIENPTLFSLPRSRDCESILRRTSEGRTAACGRAVGAYGQLHGQPAMVTVKNRFKAFCWPLNTEKTEAYVLCDNRCLGHHPAAGQTLGTIIPERLQTEDVDRPSQVIAEHHQRVDTLFRCKSDLPPIHKSVLSFCAGHGWPSAWRSTAVGDLIAPR